MVSALDIPLKGHLSDRFATENPTLEVQKQILMVCDNLVDLRLFEGFRVRFAVKNRCHLTTFQQNNLNKLCNGKSSRRKSLEEICFAGPEQLYPYYGTSDLLFPYPFW